MTITSPRRFVSACALAIAVGTPLLVSGSAGAAKPSTAWSSYFYPARVGRTCQEVVKSPTISGEETLRVAAVTKTSQGVNVTVDESSSTQAAGKDVPTNAALHYMLGRNGDLVSTPSSVLLGSRGAQLVGNTVLPGIDELFAGTKTTTYVTEVLPLSASELSELKGAIAGHQTSLRIKVGLRESGQAVASLTVPLGTFHHVLKVSTTLGSVMVTNAASGAAAEFSKALEPEFKKLLNTVTWYAKGVGPIQFSLSGIFGKMTTCSG